MLKYMEFKCVFLLFIYISTLFMRSTVSTAIPCLEKYFSGSSFVCVCNSTYCDTVESETKLPKGHYVVYSSSKAKFRLQKSVLPLRKKSSSATVSFMVELNETRQTIVGFGGTFTDASGINIVSLPKSAQDNLIESYFGPSGIEYTLNRIPIASNDMSTGVYSYDFTMGDTSLTKFTIAMEDHMYKLPYINQAVAISRRNLSLVASPWSSPDWMKSNGNMAGVGTLVANMSKVYANYLARFLREYQSFMFGGSIWGLTPQSGPTRSCDNTSKPIYQSLCWTAEQMRNWIIQELKPSLKDYGYDSVKVLIMDDNRDQLSNWSDVFQDQEAKYAIDGFAVQGYHDSETSLFILDNTHNQFSNKIILASEYCIRDTPVVALGSWERGEQVAMHIFQDLQHFVSGFIDYNLALDLNGGPSWAQNNADSPIIVDQSNGAFYKQPMFYFMGHFSKFIPPGSIGIELKSIGAVSTVNPAVSFLRPDNSIVVVIANMQEKDCVVNISHGDYTIQHIMEASSIHSFIWWRT